MFSITGFNCQNVSIYKLLLNKVIQFSGIQVHSTQFEKKNCMLTLSIILIHFGVLYLLVVKEIKDYTA